MSFTRRAALAAAMSALLLAGFAPGAGAHSYTLGDLEIVHPWSRATPSGARVAGGYLKVTNRGTLPDRLVAATFAGARSVEVHEMAHEGGVMRMRELPRGLEIPPGATVELRPGGFHLMFMGLAGPLREKDRVRGELVFERAGRIEVDFAVESMGARGGHHHDHGAARTQ